ncbi:hypothetical protein KAR91_10240, partial [Candidatus Pacearchaeota archaeon]|nr:hypothetical protein [Candidatus Pacearchaeota archaeon]
MATNREKIIAVDLTTNTRRIGHLMWVQENALQGKDHDGNPLLNQTIIATGDLPGDETPPSLTEADVVIQCKANRDLIVERTRDIETVLAK